MMRKDCARRVMDMKESIESYDKNMETEHLHSQRSVDGAWTLQAIRLL